MARDLPAALAPLKKLKQWVIWKSVKRDGKVTKPPFRADAPDKFASTTDPSTWSDYSTARGAAAQLKGGGIGFIVHGPVCGLDLDDCVRDDGTFEPWAKEIIDRCPPGTYIEVSPSGRGLRIIGLTSSQKRIDTRRGDLEIYRNTARYLTITGNVIRECQELTNLDALIDGLAELGPGEEKGGDGDGTLSGTKMDSSKAFSRVVRRLADQGLSPDEIVEHLRKHPERYRNTKAAAYDKRGKGKLLQFVTSEFGRWKEGKPAEVLKVKWTLGAVPKPCLADTILAIKHLEPELELHHDIFHDVVLIDGRRLDDYKEQDIRRKILDVFKFDPGDKHVRDALSMVAREDSNIVHPVLDYLDALEWDGVKRLDNWVCTYLGVPNKSHYKAIGRKVMVAAVRRIRQPGAKFDQIIVLEGDEGLGKSSAIEILAGEENFSDQTILGLSDKDQQENLKGIWLYEIADLKGMRHVDVVHIKAFVTRRIDRARAAYAHRVAWQDRTAVLFATTNDDLYLKEARGNRRWWPLPVTEIDLEALKRDRDQLWAEAAVYESNDEVLQLPEEMWGRLRIEQDARLEYDPWTELLREAAGTRQFDAKEGMTIERVASADLMQDELKLKTNDQSPLAARRLASCMRQLGWNGPEKVRVYKNQGPIMGYWRAVVDEEEEVGGGRRTS